MYGGRERERDREISMHMALRLINNLVRSVMITAGSVRAENGCAGEMA